MSTSFLLTTAVFIGFTHTLIGIDHYVPFVVLSKANAWSLKKTMWIVLLCGIGHVLSSVLLGLIGIALSQSLSFLVNIETLARHSGNQFHDRVWFDLHRMGFDAAVQKQTAYPSDPR